MKPQGIIDYLFPWFIPLFCFLAGYLIYPLIYPIDSDSITIERLS